MNVHIKQKLLTLHSNAISEHLFATIYKKGDIMRHHNGEAS